MILIEWLKPRLSRAMTEVQTPRGWLWVLAAVVAGFLAYYWDIREGRERAQLDESGSFENATTLIPAGFVLVPIEVANFEALDSILGQFGVVDLYLATDDPKRRAVKVAEKLRILRAPLNPSRFAVLARESESARLVMHNGPFTVVVQNSALTGTGVVNGSQAHADSDERNESKNRSRKHGRSRITVEVVGNES